jgi:phospholipid/cholesterol/gamma-HCH transport system substrate-binding protein
MSKQNRKYIITGVLVVVILGASYWGFNFLKGNDLFNKQHTYHVVYDQIEGLNVSSPVTMNGFEIGQVSDIKMLTDRDSKLLVTITTEENYVVPDSSIARIYSKDLMGTKAVGIELSGKSSMHADGDTLLGATEESLKEQVSMQMLPIKNQAEDLMDEMKTAIEVVGYIFNEETQNNLKKSFASIKRTVSYLETSTQNLDSLMTQEKSRIATILNNVENITKNLNNNSEAITNTITNMSDISDSLKAANLAQTLSDVDKALNDLAVITEKINNGEGSFGQLVNNDTLYNELERASKNLDRLVWDIRANPERYVNVKLFDLRRDVQVVDESMLNKRDKKRLERKRERMNE